MNVHWTDTAIEHLEAIQAYIAKTSAEYALRIVERLIERSEQIAAFPESGRVVPEFGIPPIREVLEGPYRVIYYIKPTQIDVLAVLHSAQQAL